MSPWVFYNLGGGKLYIIYAPDRINTKHRRSQTILPKHNGISSGDTSKTPTCKHYPKLGNRLQTCKFKFYRWGKLASTTYQISHELYQPRRGLVGSAILTVENSQYLKEDCLSDIEIWRRNADAVTNYKKRHLPPLFIYGTSLLSMVVCSPYAQPD